MLSLPISRPNPRFPCAWAGPAGHLIHMCRALLHRRLPRQKRRRRVARFAKHEVPPRPPSATPSSPAIGVGSKLPPPPPTTRRRCQATVPSPHPPAGRVLSDHRLHDRRVAPTTGCHRAGRNGTSAFRTSLRSAGACQPLVRSQRSLAVSRHHHAIKCNSVSA